MGWIQSIAPGSTGKFDNRHDQNPNLHAAKKHGLGIIGPKHSNDCFTMTEDCKQTCSLWAAPSDTAPLNTALYPRVLQQPPVFGIGPHIQAGIDHDGRYTVIDRDGVKYFGPVAFGEFLDDSPLPSHHL